MENPRFLCILVSSPFSHFLFVSFVVHNSMKTAILGENGCNLQICKHPRCCIILTSILEALWLLFRVLLVPWGAIWPPGASKMVSKRRVKKASKNTSDIIPDMISELESQKLLTDDIKNLLESTLK